LAFIVFPVDLRANWGSACPALFRDPRRIRIGPSSAIVDEQPSQSDHKDVKECGDGDLL